MIALISAIQTRMSQPDSFYPSGLRSPSGACSACRTARPAGAGGGAWRSSSIPEEPYPIARARRIFEPAEVDKQMDAPCAPRWTCSSVACSRPQPPEEAYLYALNIENPAGYDMIVTAIAPPLEQRRKSMVLEPLERLKRVVQILAAEADVLELEDEIHTRAQGEVDRTQREFYLREQMKVIQTELGEGDSWSREVLELRTRIESIGLPEEVQVRAIKEVDRLAQMPAMSPKLASCVPHRLDRRTLEHLTTDNLDCATPARSLSSTITGCRASKTAFWST
jgi:ATP-dependent Lon protease